MLHGTDIPNDRLLGQEVEEDTDIDIDTGVGIGIGIGITLKTAKMKYENRYVFISALSLPAAHVVGHSLPEAIPRSQ